jgi:hypothetical protein
MSRNGFLLCSVVGSISLNRLWGVNKFNVGIALLPLRLTGLRDSEDSRHTLSVHLLFKQVLMTSNLTSPYAKFIIAA